MPLQWRNQFWQSLEEACSECVMPVLTATPPKIYSLSLRYLFVEHFEATFNYYGVEQPARRALLTSRTRCVRYLLFIHRDLVRNSYSVCDSRLGVLIYFLDFRQLLNYLFNVRGMFSVLIRGSIRHLVGSKDRAYITEPKRKNLGPRLCKTLGDDCHALR